MAQWKINQPPSLKRDRASLEGGCEGRLDGLLCSCNAHICSFVWFLWFVWLILLSHSSDQ